MKPETSNYDLLVKYLLGEASAEEAKQVETWVQQSNENQQEFNSLKQLFEVSDFNAEPADVDADKAWQKVKAKMESVEPGAKVIRMEQPSAESNSRNFGRYFRIAAAIAGFLVVAAVLFRLYQTPEVRFASMVTRATTLTDTLPDGSIVTLNENSALSYTTAFNDDERRVYLHGEAFFHVTKNNTKPFIIVAGDAEVKVVGTSFNVKAYNEAEIVEVIVETGIVQLRSISKQESITLEPGNKGVYIKSTSQLSKSLNDDAGYAFWRSHKLTFRNTPLKDVVQMLNNYYAAGITYQNENIGRCRFTATFEDDSLNTILDILSMTFQLEIKEAASGKILSGKGCEDAPL